MSSDPDTDTDRQLRDELAPLLGPSAEPPIELGSLYAGLQTQIARERGLRAWLRSRSTPARLTIITAALLLAGVSVALFWHRPDLTVYPPARMLLTLVFGALLVAAQLWLALRPLYLPPARRAVTAALEAGALAGLLGLYILPAAHLAHPASIQAPGLAALLIRALPCLLIGLALGGACFALLRALDRGGAGRALLAGACGGVSANLLLQLHCPVTAPAHLLLGHLGAALALVAGVTLWARRAA